MCVYSCKCVWQCLHMCVCVCVNVYTAGLYCSVGECCQLSLYTCVCVLFDGVCCVVGAVLYKVLVPLCVCLKYVHVRTCALCVCSVY